MARRGGYTRNAEGIEWAKLSEQLDAEGKLSAVSMGQSYYVWLNDAVAHHVFRCEQLKAQERYQQDQAEATRTNSYTVDPLSPKYQVTRAKPTITRASVSEQGSGVTGRTYRP